MIGLLMGLGLSQKVAKLVAYIAIPLLILAAFYLLLDAYGDSRYDAGKKDTAAAYQKASDKVIAQAANARGKADIKAAAAAADFAAKQETEKEKIDAAVADGSSPFDVLFNAE